MVAETHYKSLAFLNIYYINIMLYKHVPQHFPLHYKHVPQHLGKKEEKSAQNLQYCNQDITFLGENKEMAQNLVPNCPQNSATIADWDNCRRHK